MPIWDHLDSRQYIGLHPWVWIQLESAEPPGPFPFMGGVAPEVVASLHEVHSILLSSVETAISDVFARRASLDDPSLRERLEEVMTELSHREREILRLREKINELLVKHTGQSLEKIQKDTDRDYFMTAEEAKKYGIIDEVIYGKRK